MQTVRSLLLAGANVNAQDLTGTTPLLAPFVTEAVQLEVGSHLHLNLNPYMFVMKLICHFIRAKRHLREYYGLQCDRMLVHKSCWTSRTAGRLLTPEVLLTGADSYISAFLVLPNYILCAWMTFR